MRLTVTLLLVLGCHTDPVDSSPETDAIDTDTVETDTTPDERYVRFAQVFSDHCSSCHLNGKHSGRLQLDADVAYDELVGVACDGDDSWLRVKCGDVDNSALYQKLTLSPPFGEHMPPELASIGDEDMAIVSDWILADCPR